MSRCRGQNIAFSMFDPGIIPFYIFVHESQFIEYTKNIDTSNKVLEHIAKDHEKVKKGVESVMGGKILEYEAKTIWKNGLAAGISQGKFQALSEMVRDDFISAAEAAKRLGISTEEFQKLLNN